MEKSLVHLTPRFVVRKPREIEYSDIYKMFRRYSPYDQDRHLYRILSQIEPDAVRIATCRGQLVGCAYGHFHSNGTGTVAGLFMVKNYASKELAFQLIQSCVDRLIKLGCSDIFAEAKTDDPIINAYENVGFKKFGTRRWSFLELDDRSVDRKSISIERSFLPSAVNDSQFIPYRFWYTRVMTSQMLYESEAINLATSDNGTTFAIWQDVTALSIKVGKRNSYFLFDKKCAELIDLGSPCIIREISHAEGSHRLQLVMQLVQEATDAKAVLLHMSDDEPSQYALAGFRFSSTRQLLRLSVGRSLDEFLH